VSTAKHNYRKAETELLIKNFNLILLIIWSNKWDRVTQIQLIEHGFCLPPSVFRVFTISILVCGFGKWNPEKSLRCVVWFTRFARWGCWISCTQFCLTWNINLSYFITWSINFLALPTIALLLAWYVCLLESVTDDFNPICEFLRFETTHF